MEPEVFTIREGLTSEGAFFHAFEKLDLKEQDFLKKRLRELGTSVDIYQNMQIEGNEAKIKLLREQFAHEFRELVLRFLVGDLL